MRYRKTGALCGAVAMLLAMSARAAPLTTSCALPRAPAVLTAFMLLDVGLQAGIFKKHGLDVQESSIDGAARLHQAMVSNSIDIALGAGTDIAFIAKGSPGKGCRRDGDRTAQHGAGRQRE